MGTRSRGRSNAEHAYLFTAEPDKSLLGHDRVGNYRTKTIKAGDLLEVRAYPVWNTRSERKRARARYTRAAQQAQNEKNAVDKFIWLVNANFGAGDLHVTLTYKGWISEEEARRDVRNYLRRIARYRKREGLPDMKYLYVIEFDEEPGRRTRYHHHVIMTGMDRDVAEQLWTGGYANADRLQPNADGLRPVALYLAKNPYGRRRWGGSLNLTKPAVTVADKKLSKRRAARIAADADADGREIFEKLYPEYRLIGDVSVRSSEFVAGVYITAKMVRRCDSDIRTPKTRARACAGARINERETKA